MSLLRFSTVATLAHILIISNLVSTQHFPRNTALNGTLSPTKTSSSPGSATSFFSAIYGPHLAAVSSTWAQVIIPTTVGTVLVVVNAATNETTSTTIYHTDFLKNGSSTLLLRTDTDAAGTVTQVVTDARKNRTMTVTYPTNYFTVSDSLTWDAILPTTVSDTTCCFNIPTYSANPTHTPFVQVGPLNSEDHRGWLYSLVGNQQGEAVTNLDSIEVSSLWSGTTLEIEYEGCPYTYCALGVSSVSPAQGVKAQPGAILATTTTTISIPSATPSSSAGPSSTSSFTAIPDQETTKSPEPVPESTQPASTKVSGAPPQTLSPTPEPLSFSTTAKPETNPRPSQKPESQQQIPSTSSTPQPSPSQEPGTTPIPAPAQTSSGRNPTSGPVPSSKVVSSAPTLTENPVVVITIGSSAISANSASQFVISGQTLVAGASVTIGSGSSTTVVALQTRASNTVLVVGGSSSTLKAPKVDVLAVTVGGSVVTADSSSNYIIGGQTLLPGGSAINVGGTTISLATDGTQIVEGTKTILQSTGVGGIIWSVFSGETPTESAGNSTATPTQVLASGVGRIRVAWSLGALVVVCFTFLM